MEDFRRKSSIKIELAKDTIAEENSETETFSPELNRKSRELTKGHVTVFNRLEEIAELTKKNSIELKEKYDNEKEEELKQVVTFQPVLKTKTTGPRRTHKQFVKHMSDWQELRDKSIKDKRQ